MIQLSSTSPNSQRFPSGKPPLTALNVVLETLKCGQCRFLLLLNSYSRIFSRGNETSAPLSRLCRVSERPGRPRATRRAPRSPPRDLPAIAIERPSSDARDPAVRSSDPIIRPTSPSRNTALHHVLLALYYRTIAGSRTLRGHLREIQLAQRVTHSVFVCFFLSLAARSFRSTQGDPPPGNVFVEGPSEADRGLQHGYGRCPSTTGSSAGLESRLRYHVAKGVRTVRSTGERAGPSRANFTP